MQPYLMYGFGIRARHLSKADRQRLIDSSENIFSWFTEDFAGSDEDDAGVYYLIASSPWSRESGSEVDKPWADDWESIMRFKNENEADVSKRIITLGLQEYEPHVEFLVSSTEV
tara:strand:- start:1113 stop:1454 length:342 start_codon:yes stop_codon:yes gene_type:complete